MARLIALALALHACSVAGFLGGGSQRANRAQVNKDHAISQTRKATCRATMAPVVTIASVQRVTRAVRSAQRHRVVCQNAVARVMAFLLLIPVTRVEAVNLSQRSCHCFAGGHDGRTGRDAARARVPEGGQAVEDR